ncbi:hypothetical protein LNKW23_05640 [Paralimibaculum aggregatum]|uniref:HTH tetR-type domain-containing protein n=1 Tax=Paralimibaculum aggregatum TaxID=3036245 RepID=A0ABQ6LLQ2_9RHOB|nr:TetR/AcrR family transcriptional regulator [Limibaculum sp. NKW23]GMG81351.1 hypothetical protein LNKW23_05640 [Limibaculum sp. NKW23]
MTSAKSEPLPSANDEAHSRIRGEILDEAEALFCHYGFWKTNMSDIARACGMSTANLYRYFRNKQAIGLAAVGRHFSAEEAVGAAAIAEAGPDPEARIRALLRAVVRHTVEAMDTYPKMIEMAEFVCGDEEGYSLLEAHIRWRREQIAAALAEGAAAGAFDVDDAERTAIALQHAVKAFCMPFSLAQWRDRTTVMPELEAVLDLAFRGIRRAGG